MKALTGHNYRRELRETQQGNIGDVFADDGDFIIQCKIGKTPPIWKALPEAEVADRRRRDQLNLLLPIGVIHRDQRGAEKPEHLIIMRPWVLAWLLGAPINAPLDW